MTPEQIVEELERFLEQLNTAIQAAKEQRTGTADNFLSMLRRSAAKVGLLVDDILGNNASALIANSILNPTIVAGTGSYAAASVERAIGAVQGGLYPRRAPASVLMIADEELKRRCVPLLSGSQPFDTALREATTILETRIRTKVPQSVLAERLPDARQHTGEKLVDGLFKPGDPAIMVSDEQMERVAFRKALIGFISYVRHPVYHSISDDVEVSWAWSVVSGQWSVVGTVDRLLTELADATVQQSPPST